MRRAIIWLIIPVVFLLSACSKKQGDLDPSGAPPLVVVSIPPYIEFVSKIAGDTVSVISAVPEQYDPHIFEMTPSRLNELSDASLWIGVHEPFEDKIIPILERDNKSFTYLDLTTKVPLLKFRQDTQVFADEDEHHHHHHEEQGCCGKEGYDRHIWMSPRLALIQAKTIKEALTNLLPEFAMEYEKNYQKFSRELSALNEDLTHLLHPIRGSSLLVNHASLGYFCEDFGLHQLAIETAGKALLPHQLELIDQTAREKALTCIYVLPQFEEKSSIEIAKQLNLKVVHIDPLKKDYIENMRYIASMIIGCKIHQNASTH